MFPRDFLFGVAMSGFQFEMGKENSKDENTDWYIWTHDLQNQANGVVSRDLVEEGAGYWIDYARVHELCSRIGMNVIRIGIEWSRIFPQPTYGIKDLSQIADMKAVEHYKQIIEDAKSKGLKVIVNLNHFTLPLWLHDPIKVSRFNDFSRSGWLDDRAIDEFTKFAAFCAKSFGGIADAFSTMNEPNVVAKLGYFGRFSGFPPSLLNIDLYEKALDNQILAHNKAYETMKQFTNKPVGIIYATSWCEGDDARNDAMELENWYFLDKAINHADFLGVNYYTRAIVKRTPSVLSSSSGKIKINWSFIPGFGGSCQRNSKSLDGRPSTDNGWEIYPEGLGYVLRSCHDRYKKPIYVTENGVADDRDIYRPYSLLAHLKIVEDCLKENMDLRGYMHWSIIDNFEWPMGYSMRFGLVRVDFKQKLFTPRPSYYLFGQIINSRTTEPFLNLLKAWEERI
ncbi:MAG TPA: glycoside hydrolase family 1 protein [Pseudothermotoga sp.]